MTSPRPWREEETHDDAVRVVSLVAGIEPRPVARSAWDDVLARAMAPHRDWRLVPAFGLSLLAGALLVVGGRGVMPARPPATASSVAQAVRVTSSPGTRFERLPEGRVVLAEGRLTVAAQGARPVHLETPHVQVDAVRARFLAEVLQGGTRVVVEEGQVVVRTHDGQRRLEAGQSTVWPPTPTIPEALLTEAVEAAPSCAASSGSRRDCLARESEQQGLEAQAALYELGALEAKEGHPAEAVAAFRASLERFPTGVLHPEARLALLVELVRSRRFAEAAAEARHFERQCPDDPRLSDVVGLREALEALAQP